MTPEQKIEQIHSLIKELIEDAERTKGLFTTDNCPMGKHVDHYKNSQILDGIGCYEWNCPFCGEKSSG